MKPTNRDIYDLLLQVNHKVDKLIRPKLDLSEEDALVKAETDRVRTAKGHVPPSGPVNQ